MHPAKALLSGLVVAALVAAPLSSASAAWRHRGLVPDLFGAAAAVVVGAATIATAPLAIIAGAGPRGYYGGPPGYAYDGPPRGYYGGPPGYAYDGLRAGIMLPRQSDITLHPAIMVRHPAITPRDPSASRAPRPVLLNGSRDFLNEESLAADSAARPAAVARRARRRRSSDKNPDRRRAVSSRRLWGGRHRNDRPRRARFETHVLSTISNKAVLVHGCGLSDRRAPASGKPTRGSSKAMI